MKTTPLEKKRKKLRLVPLAMAIAAAFSIRTQADAVLDWNAIAAQTIFAGGRPGPSPTLDFAVVHAAIHDAIQAYDKNFEPYATKICDAAGSPAAAVAKAAHDVLVNRFSAQTALIDTAYADYLTANGLAMDDPGVSVGAQAAAGMITLRTGDGSFPNPPPIFVGANAIGWWRPTPSYVPGFGPPTLSPMAAPWLAEVTPFVVESNDQFLSGPPLPLTSKGYAKDYNEVKALGAAVNSARTPEQTQIAHFWNGNFFAQINGIARQLAQNQLNNSADRARLFALVWLTAADGVITTWTSKLTYPTWRPITAINEGDSDGNKWTAGDSNWKPLINTPNYPEHCSGANAFVRGTTKMMEIFFHNDHLNFSVSTTNPNAAPKTREYHRLSDVAADVLEARIYQGIHYRAADLEGRKLGGRVAKYVFKHALRPLHGDDSGDECCNSNDDD